MLIALIDGYHETAEWLLLIAAILFGVAALLIILARPERPDPSRGALIAVGLCLTALGWLVL